MSLRQYADGIFGWSRFQPERGYDFNGTAIVTTEGVLLVDPVAATEAEHAAIAKLGHQFGIVLLNAHHERDAAAFRDRYHAPVLVAAADAAELRLTGAETFGNGHRLPGGCVVHTLAGMKTPGESIIHDPVGRVVVVGDAIIGDPLTGFRLVPPAKLPTRTEALAALSYLCTLDFDGLILGDGFSLPSGGREALRKFVASQRSAA